MTTRGDGLRIRVWNENVHERRGTPEGIAERYPDGIHGAVAAGLRDRLPRADVATATLDEPGQGLPDEALEATDVLFWWGHIAHDEVDDALVERIRARVHAGMGLVALHSGHFSKVFTRLLGTSGSLGWRDDGDRELVWTVKPGHPIARGIPQPLVIPEQETYAEHFDIPDPDEVVFISSFAGGEVFRSGVTFTRGRGRLFYFGPGDQAYPVYAQAEVLDVLANAAEWVAPSGGVGVAPAVSHLERGWFEG